MSRRTSRQELERRAGEHLDELAGELQALGLELRCRASPLERARAHPVAVAALAGLLEVGIVALRGWRDNRHNRRRRDDRRSRPAPPGFARIFLSGIASTLGLTLSDWLLAELARRTAARPAAAGRATDAP